MFCSKCGKQVADGANFCSACGNPVGNTVKFFNGFRILKYEDFYLTNAHVSSLAGTLFLTTDRLVWVVGDNKAHIMLADIINISVSVYTGKEIMEIATLSEKFYFVQSDGILQFLNLVTLFSPTTNHYITVKTLEQKNSRLLAWQEAIEYQRRQCM